MVVVKKWLQGWAELLVFFPVILLMGVYLYFPYHLWPWIGSLPFFYLLGIVTRTFVGERWSRLYPLIGNAAAAGLVLLVTGLSFAAVPGWAFGLFLFYRGLRLVEYRWEELFPTLFFWSGFFIYFFSFFIYQYLYDLTPFISIVTWAGVLNIIVSLVIMNRRQLKAAALSGKQEPILSRILLRHNGILVLATLAGIFLIVGYRQIKDGFFWIVHKIGYGLFSLYIFLIGLLGHGTMDQPQEDSGGMLDNLLNKGMEKDSSLWELIINVVSVIITTTLAIILLVMLIKWLYKGTIKLIELIRWILKSGRGYEEGKGYEDEQERLLEWKDISKRYVDRMKDWITGLLEREPKWSELKTNGERVRYLYRHLILGSIARGYSYKSALTPQETAQDLERWNPEKTQGAEEIAALYAKIRYGEGDVEDEAVEKARKHFTKEQL